MALFVTAFLSVAAMGGTVYGWPSMRPILRRDGVLLGPCAGQNVTHATCDWQERSFGLVYTLGAWANQGGRFFVGIALDQFGPRRVAACCALLFACGSLAFGLDESVGGLAVGLMLIGLGGAGVQLSVQSVSALFPRNRSLVMASLSGAFQLASGVWLIFELLHRSGASRRQMQLGYAAVALAISVFSLLMWPSRPFGVAAKAKVAVVSSAVPVSRPMDGDEPQRGQVPDPVAVKGSGKPAAAESRGDDSPGGPRGERGDGVAVGAAQRPTKTPPLRERAFWAQAKSAEYWLLLTFSQATRCSASSPWAPSGNSWSSRATAARRGEASPPRSRSRSSPRRSSAWRSTGSGSRTHLP